MTPFTVGDRVKWTTRKKGAHYSLKFAGIIKTIDDGMASIVALPTASKGFGTKRVILERLEHLEP